MTLGMAASSSVAKEIGFLNGLGHISVTRTATATDRGTAIKSARIDETSVPKINGRAPNSPATGSHELVAKKWKPNFCHASAERCKSSDNVSATTTSIVRPATVIRPRNPESRLNMERRHAGAFCAVVKSEIFEDSDVPIGSVDRGRTTGPSVCLSGTEKCFSGEAPINAFALILNSAS